MVSFPILQMTDYGGNLFIFMCPYFSFFWMGPHFRALLNLPFPKLVLRKLQSTKLSYPSECPPPFLGTLNCPPLQFVVNIPIWIQPNLPQSFCFNVKISSFEYGSKSQRTSSAVAQQKGAATFRKQCKFGQEMFIREQPGSSSIVFPLFWSYYNPYGSINKFCIKKIFFIRIQA